MVEAVADGSSVAAAGVQRGMALTAISDPVRRNEVWHLQVRWEGGEWVLVPLPATGQHTHRLHAGAVP